MTDLIVILVVVLVVGGAGWYIRREKKRDVKCIGCPAAKNGCCSANCSGEF